MLIEFTFKEFLTENLGRVLKPFAEVTLQNGDHLEKVNMLIDSGADVTLIRKSRGEDLGLTPPEPSEVKRLGGIAGGVPVAYRTMELKVCEVSFPCRVAWAQTENVPSVLGRLDVFDKFDIEFKQGDRKILFKPKQANRVRH